MKKWLGNNCKFNLMLKLIKIYKNIFTQNLPLPLYLKGRKEACFQNNCRNTATHLKIIYFSKICLEIIHDDLCWAITAICFAQADAKHATFNTNLCTL